MSSSYCFVWENYVSHDSLSRKYVIVTPLPVIPYRPEVGVLILFPVLQGKNGGSFVQDCVSEPQSFAILSRGTSDRLLAGVGYARGHSRGCQTASFRHACLYCGPRGKCCGSRGSRLDVPLPRRWREQSLSHKFEGRGRADPQGGLATAGVLRDPGPGFQEAPGLVPATLGFGA